MVADTQQLPLPLVMHWEWQTKAACRGLGSDMFFHPAEERNAARNDRITAAKAICQTCPVITECLDHALRVREPYGVWGGQSESERAELLGVDSLRYPAAIRSLTSPPS